MRVLLWFFPSLLAAAACREAVPACRERLALGRGSFQIVYRSLPLTVPNPAVVRAFVMVHGNTRNPDAYFTTAIQSAREAGRLDDTLVVAPAFRGSSARCPDALEPGEIAFPCNGWKDGQRATNAALDSFQVMDVLLQLLDNPARFPNLKEIIVAGHSAGGQYVDRYAAANTAEPKLRARVRYVVANPSSYLYLDGWRPVARAVASCPGYNAYKYGLEKLSAYAGRVGAGTMAKQFVSRKVLYLSGDRDVNQDPDLDKTCPAETQGHNRRERAMNFAAYMRERFHAGHEFVTIPGCGHSAACMYKSEAAVAALFGK